MPQIQRWQLESRVTSKEPPFAAHYLILIDDAADKTVELTLIGTDLRPLAATLRSGATPGVFTSARVSSDPDNWTAPAATYIAIADELERAAVEHGF